MPTDVTLNNQLIVTFQGDDVVTAHRVFKKLKKYADSDVNKVGFKGGKEFSRSEHELINGVFEAVTQAKEYNNNMTKDINISYDNDDKKQG